MRKDIEMTTLETLPPYRISGKYVEYEHRVSIIINPQGDSHLRDEVWMLNNDGDGSRELIEVNRLPTYSSI